MLHVLYLKGLSAMYSKFGEMCKNIAREKTHKDGSARRLEAVTISATLIRTNVNGIGMEMVIQIMDAQNRNALGKAKMRVQLHHVASGKVAGDGKVFV